MLINRLCHARLCPGKRPCSDPNEELTCITSTATMASLLGYHLAEASLFISVTMSLAILKISRDVVNGVEIGRAHV